MLDIHLLLFLLLLLLPFTYSHPCNFNSLIYSPECIFSEKNHQFLCVSAKTDETVSCPTTNTTAGGNDPGNSCVFPFIHKGKKQFGCLPSKRPRDHGRRYCATTANYDKDGLWTFCYVSRNSLHATCTLKTILTFEVVIFCILLIVYCVLKIRLLNLKSLNFLRALSKEEKTTSDCELFSSQSRSMTEDNSKEEKQDDSRKNEDLSLYIAYETQTSSTPLLGNDELGESTV